MDQTLRLCSQIKKTIADVDLLSETESEMDKGVVNRMDGYSRNNSGIGSPESPNEIDDKTFREQVDQLLREARDYINDEENNDADYMATQSTDMSREMSRQPSTSISLVHYDSVEEKTDQHYAPEDYTTTQSASENGFGSPASSMARIGFRSRRTKPSLTLRPDLGDLNSQKEDEPYVRDHHQPAFSSRSTENDLPALENYRSMDNDIARLNEYQAEFANLENTQAGLLSENTDLKKELENLKTRCADLAQGKVNLDQELTKVKTEMSRRRDEVKRTKLEQAKEKAKDKAGLTKMKTLLSQTKVEMSQVRTDMAKTKTELARAKTEQSQGRTELSEAKSELAKANEAIQVEQAKLKELQKVVNNFEQEKLQLQLKETNAQKQLQEKLNAVEEEKTDLQTRNKKLKNDLGTLKDYVEKLESKKVEQEEESKKLQLLSEKRWKSNIDLQLHCKSLMKERRELQSLCDEHEKMTNNVQQHCQSLMQEREELKMLSDEQQKVTSETKLCLEKTKSSMRKENWNLQKTIKRLNIQKGDLEQTNATFKIEKGLLEKKADQLELENAEITKKLQEKTEELTRVTGELADVESAGVARSTMYVELRKENQRLTKETADVNEKMMKFKDSNHGLARELGRYKAENSEIDSNMRLLNADMTTMKLSFAGELKERDEETERMKSQLAKAQRERCTAKEQLEEMYTNVSTLVKLCSDGAKVMKPLLPNIDGGSTRTENKKRWLTLSEHILGIANELRNTREESQNLRKEMNAVTVRYGELQSKYDALCIRHLKSLKDIPLPQRRN